MSEVLSLTHFVLLRRLSFSATCLLQAGVYRYYSDMRIKSRGLDFLVAIFTFAYCDLFFGLFIVLAYLGRLPGMTYLGAMSGPDSPIYLPAIGGM